jgi:hypothetical protein
MIYQTPTLLTFEVSWHVESDNIPMAIADAEEFLAERFMEDVADTCGGASFVIVETRLPETVPDTMHEIVFHIVTTMDGAKIMQAHDFEIEPLWPEGQHPDWDYRAVAHDGMTWGELSGLIQRSLAQRDIKPDDIASFTDDNDPEAPWYILTGIRKGDNGWFFTGEEFRP